MIILFDEFDKTFSGKHGGGNEKAQTELLSLFDGIAMGKKLFVITCNHLTGLNDYLVNRPGVFIITFALNIRPQRKSVSIWKIISWNLNIKKLIK